MRRPSRAFLASVLLERAQILDDEKLRRYIGDLTHLVEDDGGVGALRINDIPLAQFEIAARIGKEHRDASGRRPGVTGHRVPDR